MAKGYVLVVDDDSLIRKSLYEVLRLDGYEVTLSSNGVEALEELEKSSYNVVLADMKMPHMDGIELLKQINQNQLRTSVVLMTGYGSIETAVESMRYGAFDYITKPISDKEIKILLQKAIEQQNLIKENESLKQELFAVTHRFHNIIGQNEKMQKIYNLIKTISNTKATVLLQGESGTGKRVIAHAIHSNDLSRKDKPLIEVSCGALPESILESELFGHTKGSFTSAIKDRMGRFELADGGTILLDEIDAFTLSLQVKLLRVLQEREFERVGGTNTVKVDVRVIAATNRDLEKAVKNGTFRKDLYYRLNVISIEIPPLREKAEDIPLLTEHFLKIYNQESNKQIKSISKDAMKAMLEYKWPGNVRELENVIERAVILAKGSTITKEDLPEFLQEPDGFSYLLDEINSWSLKEALRGPERRIIQDALERTDWNRKKAAALLGINRTTLYNKMKEYQLGENGDSSLFD